MTALALVDRLRALGPEKARTVLAAIEADLGPAGVASLRYEPRFWLRPAQIVEAPYATIEVFKGERRSGKSFAARELFVRLLPTAPYPRIMVATDGAASKTVFKSGSGLKDWTPPHIRCEFVKSSGYAGDILLGPHTITVTSAAAPVGSIGPGFGLTWADDPAAWIEAVGAAQAANAWNHMLKSNSDRPGIVIVSTTGRGVEFLYRLLDTKEHRHMLGSVRVHDLGTVENNAGNLTASYIRDIVPGLRAANEWEEGGDPTGAFALVEWPKIRVEFAPTLQQITLNIDPAKSGRSTACEVGVTATGIDDRATIYGIADRSRKMSAEEWPSAAWDLHDELRERYPGVPIRFVVENNTGDAPAALVRAEEKIRRARRGQPAQSITEIREVTSRPNDSKTRRAGPIVALAKGGQVRMLPGLGVLEGQLSALADSAPGNDRADSFVHGARDLAGITDDKGAKIAREAERAASATAASFAGLVEAQRGFSAPAFDMDRA